MRAEPRPLWPGWEKAVHDIACRSMHAMHAWLFTKRLARKKASEGQTKDTIKPLVGQRLCGINEHGGMQNRSGPMSAAPYPVQVALQVLFPAVAVR